jgi:thiol-disulfide isomerase/thioredoxin
MPNKILFRLLILLFLLCPPALAGFSVTTESGDRIEVRVWGESNTGPLYIWLLNQYAETGRYDSLAAALAEQGASVWRVDLLDALMLERTAEAIRNMSGDPVASLLQAAVKTERRPIVLVASDRMAVPLLKGMREWQVRRQSSKDAAGKADAVAGGILFFPNLFRGTPVAGEEPELMEIVSATNLPLMIMQPELGSNRGRLPGLLKTLHTAGSPAYTWLVPEVRDYYLLQTEKPQSESLQAMAGKVPEPVERAISATPRRIQMAARLLDASPKPSKPRPISEVQLKASAPAYGLIERPRRPAPDFKLLDAHGKIHSLKQGPNPGRVTLVNFWATWCPPCVHEIPSMNRLAAAYDEREFGIVSINFKEDPQHVLAFLKRVNVDFPVLLDDDGAVSGRWKVFAFPSSFLLDRQGNIRYSVNTAIEWDDPEVKTVIQRLLNEDRPAK